MGPSLADSNPIFVLFNNRLNRADYAAAVSAAEALPEPSTAVVVLVGAGVALLGGRRRGSRAFSQGIRTPYLIRRPRLGRDVPEAMSFRV